VRAVSNWHHVGCPGESDDPLKRFRLTQTTIVAGLRAPAIEYAIVYTTHTDPTTRAMARRCAHDGTTRTTMHIAARRRVVSLWGFMVCWVWQIGTTAAW